MKTTDLHLTTLSCWLLPCPLLSPSELKLHLPGADPAPGWTHRQQLCCLGLLVPPRRCRVGLGGGGRPPALLCRGCMKTLILFCHSCKEHRAHPAPCRGGSDWAPEVQSQNTSWFREEDQHLLGQPHLLLLHPKQPGCLQPLCLAPHRLHLGGAKEVVSTMCHALSPQQPCPTPPGLMSSPWAQLCGHDWCPANPWEVLWVT